MDEPPPLDQSGRPSEAELGRLALKLLRELAQQDPVLAARIAALGIDPEDNHPR